MADVEDHEGDGVWWRRGSLIGRGAFGSVYLATSLPGSHLPPLLVVKSSRCPSSSLEERSVLCGVGSSPFIIKFLGSEVTMSLKYVPSYELLFEYASGGSLRDLIKKSHGRGLPEPHVRRYTLDILQGLSHIHSRGYVHCDIKPDNILLVPRGTGYVHTCADESRFIAKIGDLGLAKRVQTRDCGLRGTLNYIAPEVVMEKEQGPPSDIWALGCVVLEMLTADLPWNFNGDGVPTTHGPPQAKSVEATEFIEACMMWNPQDRSTAETLMSHPFVAGLDKEPVGMSKEKKKRKLPLTCQQNKRLKAPKEIPLIIID